VRATLAAGGPAADHPPVSDVCPACATPLPEGVARCANCGRVDLDRARAISRAGAAAVAAQARAVPATRILLYGSLAAAFAALGLRSAFPDGGPVPAIAEQVLYLAVIGLGLRTLGPTGAARMLGGRVRAAHLLPSILAGVVAGLGLWGWTLLVRRLDPSDAPDPGSIGTAAFVSLLLVPGLVQETLSRGDTWAALRSLRSARWTALVTAAQFAAVYGIASGVSLLAAPYRFAMGLLFGLLRERTGSLAPCLAAHALALGIALALLS
jgi:membrane protease YdiL (CAAX protease family)